VSILKKAKKFISHVDVIDCIETDTEANWKKKGDHIRDSIESGGSMRIR
jgi:Zn ribbon nucleic-acid-binding protein